MDSNLICEVCGKDLSKDIDDGIILLVKDKNQKVIGVRICCRGNCHSTLESDARKKGFDCGFKEMNNGLKELYFKDDFTSESLAKYENILLLLRHLI